MILSQNNICEIWPAGKELMIPVGTTAYHLNPPHREYTPGNKLKAGDRNGNVLVSRKEFIVHLREVPVMLRRGETGPCVHLVWCSLYFAVTNLAQISTKIDSTKSFLSSDELEERLKPHVSEALQSFEEYDLTSKNGRKLFESQAANHISVMPGFKIEKCTLRKVLLEQDYFEEKKCWAEFKLRLQQLVNDQSIAEALEKNRLEEVLSKLESRPITTLLTTKEKKGPAEARLDKYMEIFGLFVEGKQTIQIKDEKGEEQRDKMIDLLAEIRDRVAPPMAQNSSDGIARIVAKRPLSDVVIESVNEGMSLSVILDELEEMQYKELRVTLNKLVCL